MELNANLLLQNQVRDNSDELQSFLRDMDLWEKDMKKREVELKMMNILDEKECPPIRNSLSRSKKRNRNKKIKDKSTSGTTKEESKTHEGRISAYNYKAWDKFDVDSELKKIDGKEKEPSSSDSSEEEAEMNIQSRRQLAIIKKDNGNKFFKDGNYDSAINCYTIGMELDPENALLPANRAMAFLKKEQYQAAENDCTQCLSLDSSYVKAYLRRGSARMALKKLLLAQSDFLKVLELEPENKQAQLELDKINKEMSLEMDDFKLENIEAQSGISSGARKRNIEVMEEQAVGLEKDKCTKLDVTGSAADNFDMVIPTVASNNDANVVRVTAVPKTESVQPIEQIEDMLNETKLSCNKILCNGSKDKLLVLEPPPLPPVPATSFQFFTDWQHISKYPDLKYNYLKQIPPSSLQALFKHYIENELFPEILHTLSTSFIEKEDDVYHYMKSLATVGRFRTMLMFMSESEKQDVRKLKNYLEISNYDSTEVNALLKLYDAV